jgi:hypothetical protein
LTVYTTPQPTGTIRYMLSNSTILKKILPFLAVFVMALFIAGYEFATTSFRATEAQGTPIRVEIVNLRNPLLTYSEWSWNVFALVNDTSMLPVNLTYAVHWCLSEKGSQPCGEGNRDYFGMLTSDSMVVNSRNATQNVTHQSVKCGNVDIVVLYNNEEVGREHIDTNTQCSREVIESAGAKTQDISPSEMLDLMVDFLLPLFGISRGDDSTGGTPPADPPETPPDNPGDPGTPPDAPDDPQEPPSEPQPPTGQVCPAEGVSCSDEYRESCTLNGRSGSRICYKRNGTCSGVGDGSQCSWNPNDSYCDECDVGSNPSDPAPPPSAPEPQPPRALPPSGNVNIDKALHVINYITGNCDKKAYRTDGVDGLFGWMHQGNTNCANNLSGTNNDRDTIAELKSSASRYQNLQCVGLAKAAFAAANGVKYQRGGHAHQHCVGGNGYNFVGNSQPGQPNDLACWGISRSGPDGHIAYVVNATPRIFTVVEANFERCAGCVRQKSYTIDAAVSTMNFKGWIRK